MTKQCILYKRHGCFIKSSYATLIWLFWISWTQEWRNEKHEQMDAFKQRITIWKTHAARTNNLYKLQNTNQNKCPVLPHALFLVPSFDTPFIGIVGKNWLPRYILYPGIWSCILKLISILFLFLLLIYIFWLIDN